MITTSCHCETPTFDPDDAFEDGTGFICTGCHSNVYFTDSDQPE